MTTEGPLGKLEWHIRPATLSQLDGGSQAALGLAAAAGTAQKHIEALERAGFGDTAEDPDDIDLTQVDPEQLGALAGMFLAEATYEATLFAGCVVALRGWDDEDEAWSPWKKLTITMHRDACILVEDEEGQPCYSDDSPLHIGEFTAATQKTVVTAIRALGKGLGVGGITPEGFPGSSTVGTPSDSEELRADAS